MTSEVVTPRSRLSRLGGLLLKLVLLTFLAALLLVALLWLRYGRDLPDISILEDYRPAQTSRILASDGTLIATLYQENRVWAPLDTLSPWVTPALLATEDSRFFEHHGVDPVSIVRVLVNAALTRTVREGGSTLTMQLARNLFPMPEDDRERKVREMFLSLKLERRYSKERLLELYLNQVYFGAGAYGIHAASQVYFNKKPADLSLAEASLLAGLVQSPSRFCPLMHPERAFHRQDEVLQRMLSVKAIDSKQHGQAVAERDQMKFTGGERRAFAVDKFPYFTSRVLAELSQRYTEEQLYRGGLTIVTTLDVNLQKQAQEILSSEVERRSYDLGVDSGALVVLENGSGYIRALVGGREWSPKNQFNRAFQAKRQPGSSFKPATYAAALEAGYTPESRVLDSPVTFDDGSGQGWRPKNSDGRHLGNITMREALRGSRNVPAVKILEAVGPTPVADTGWRMGISGPIRPRLSIALGAIEATPLEMATFYSVIANGGQKLEPTTIKVVKDSIGNVMEDRRHPYGELILKPETAVALTSMLADVVRAGTGTGARVDGVPIAGKTGTTDSFRDAWFCGFSPLYTCTVWIGNDNNSPMYYSYGGDLPATIFRRVMTALHQDKKIPSFPEYRPSGATPKNFYSESDLPKVEPETVEATPEPVSEDLEPEPQPEDPDDDRDYQAPPGRSYLLPNTLDPDLPVPEGY